jgi:hypothetical protein
LCTTQVATEATQHTHIIVDNINKDTMSTPSAGGIFGHSPPQPDKKPSPALQLTTAASGAATTTGTTSISAPKPNDNYYADKDLHWWLTFARTFKSAVKTPLPDDADSDL